MSVELKAAKPDRQVTQFIVSKVVAKEKRKNISIKKHLKNFIFMTKLLRFDFFPPVAISASTAPLASSYLINKT